MESELIAIITFVAVTTFTPGPNNIACASMGILYGTRKTAGFLAGVSVGFFLILLVCGMISTTLTDILPAFENILRVIGAAYIIWLAWHTLKASYQFEENEQSLFGFSKGFFLQLLNIKVIIYALTLFSVFLNQYIHSFFDLLIAVFLLSIVGFLANITWTLFGAGIRKYLNRPRLKKGINFALSLLLVFAAVELSGVLGMFA